MKKKLFHLAAASMMAFSTFASGAEIPRVAITQLVEHPALDATHQGIIDALNDAGYHSEKIHYSHETAQGNNAIALQIAEKYAGENPAVIVAIATPSAQAAAAATHGQIPVVFAAVTDPVAAKLVSQWQKPGKNITGVSDKVQLDQHMAMINRILPNAKRIGTVYNPGEANSVAAIEELQQYGKDHDLQIETAAATKSSEVLDAANALVGKVDAIYITLDNTASSAFEAISQVSNRNKIPLFTADNNSVSRGALASLSFDYAEVGRLAGQQVARILAGEKVGDIDVVSPQDVKLVINTDAAKKQGVTIPQDVLDDAAEVIGN